MKENERKLLSTFRKLDDQSQKMLLSYSEFLATQDKHLHLETVTIEKPKTVLVNENETVVGAVKRLSASYYMLKGPELLNAATNLMSQHIMLGRESSEVILELESLFKTQYRDYCEKMAVETKD